MDFDLSEEQSIIKDSLDRLLADKYGFEDRNKFMASAEGYSAEMWERYAEMGLMALPFSEDDGGIGGGPEETMIVMESFGKALALEPYFGTVVLGGAALKLACSDEQRSELLEGVITGETKLAVGVGERHSRYDLHHVETTARKDGDSYILNGTKSVVLDGESADKIFVTARTAGDMRDEGGIGLFMVDAKTEGVTRQGYATQDGKHAAEVMLENVKVDAVNVCGDPEGALPVIRHIVDQGIAALCAEAVGVMSTMHELTVEYLKVRKQFGVPISMFQVLQHDAVDMFIAAEQARSITHYATMMSDSTDANERARAMSAAKAEIGRGGRLAGQNAIQLHGGVGMTMEYSIGHYFKRMTMIDKTFGDTDYHLERLAGMGGLFEE